MSNDERMYEMRGSGSAAQIEPNERRRTMEYCIWHVVGKLAKTIYSRVVIISALTWQLLFVSIVIVIIVSVRRLS